MDEHMNVLTAGQKLANGTGTASWKVTWGSSRTPWWQVEIVKNAQIQVTFKGPGFHGLWRARERA